MNRSDAVDKALSLIHEAEQISSGPTGTYSSSQEKIARNLDLAHAYAHLAAVLPEGAP